MPNRLYSDAEAEAVIRDEFAQVMGRVILVKDLEGYVGDAESQSLTLTTPVAVRVTGPSKPQDGLYHYVDEWLDPYWDIKVLEPHPEIPEGFRSSYMYGHSINTDNGERAMADLQFETWIQALQRWFRR